MSNNIQLVSTTFNDIAGKTYGFRMYDSYEKTYDNNAEAEISDDLALLEYAIECGDMIVREMITYCKEHNHGMTINNTWYNYDEIKVYFP